MIDRQMYAPYFANYFIRDICTLIKAIKTMRTQPITKSTTLLKTMYKCLIEKLINI